MVPPVSLTRSPPWPAGFFSRPSCISIHCLPLVCGFHGLGVVVGTSPARLLSEEEVGPGAVCYPNPGREAIRSDGDRSQRLPPRRPDFPFSVEAANQQMIRELRFTLRHSAWWASTTGPGASGPSHSSPRPRCDDAAPGSPLFGEALAFPSTSVAGLSRGRGRLTHLLGRGTPAPAPPPIPRRGGPAAPRARGGNGSAPSGHRG